MGSGKTSFVFHLSATFIWISHKPHEQKASVIEYSPLRFCVTIEYLVATGVNTKAWLCNFLYGPSPWPTRFHGYSSMLTDTSCIWSYWLRKCWQSKIPNFSGDSMPWSLASKYTVFFCESVATISELSPAKIMEGYFLMNLIPSSLLCSRIFKYVDARAMDMVKCAPI